MTHKKQKMSCDNMKSFGIFFMCHLVIPGWCGAHLSAGHQSSPTNVGVDQNLGFDSFLISMFLFGVRVVVCFLHILEFGK